MTFKRLKWASFTHSTVYLALLISWLVPGLHREEFIFGMAHGLGWFAMCALMIVALRRRIVNVRLATAVAVIGAIGPFVGSLEFIRQERQLSQGANARP